MIWRLLLGQQRFCSCVPAAPTPEEFPVLRLFPSCCKELPGAGEGQDFQNLHQSQPGLLISCLMPDEAEEPLQGWCADGIWPRGHSGSVCFLCFCVKVAPCKRSGREFSWSLCMKEIQGLLFQLNYAGKISTKFLVESSGQCHLIYVPYMWIFFFLRQDRSLLFCVVATLEPVMPSLNHIMKVAQRRRKIAMQAFGWESQDGDRAFPGSLMALCLSKGKNMFVSAWKVS